MTRLFALLAVILVPLGARAYVPYTTADGVPLHWKVRTVGYHIAADHPESFARGALERLARDAFAVWTELPCHTLSASFEGFRAGLAKDQSDRINAIVWVHDAATWNAQYSATELARTAITHRTISGEILDADIVFNLGGFAFSVDGACDPDAYDLQATLTHEVGHLLGLDHSDDPTATMDATTDPGVCVKRTLEEDDIEGYCASYAQLNPPVEPGPEPGPADAGPTDSAVVEPVEVGGAPGDDGCGAGSAGGGALALALAALLSGALRARRRWRRGPRPARAR